MALGKKADHPGQLSPPAPASVLLCVQNLKMRFANLLCDELCFVLFGNCKALDHRSKE